MSRTKKKATHPPTEHDDLLPRRRPHRSLVKRFALLAVVVVLFLLAILGAILPILQGWFFLLLALVVLATIDPRMRRLINRGERRLPDRVRSFLRTMRDKLGLGHRKRTHNARHRSSATPRS